MIFTTMLSEIQISTTSKCVQQSVNYRKQNEEAGNCLCLHFHCIVFNTSQQKFYFYQSNQNHLFSCHIWLSLTLLRFVFPSVDAMLPVFGQPKLFLSNYKQKIHSRIFCRLSVQDILKQQCSEQNLSPKCGRL